MHGGQCIVYANASGHRPSVEGSVKQEQLGGGAIRFVCVRVHGGQCLARMPEVAGYP